jgi:D-sedoheptulose 7-phosphate isomerase
MGISGPSPAPASLVAAAERLATCLGAGGRLLVDGHGRGVPDARHVVVEFMHPVTVGRRALPALEAGHGAADRRPEDATMSIAYAGASPSPGVDVELSDLPSAAPGGAAAARPTVHVRLPAEDPGAAKVAAVSSYHVIWELVHPFLDAPRDVGSGGERGEADRAASLYPMLYAGAGDGEGGFEQLRAASLRSAEAKLVESARVRTRALESNRSQLDEIAALVAGARSVFTVGNGGSSTDAADAALALGARSLVEDVATITALANDVSFEVVFARQLATLGAPGDCLVAFSTSGNSPNLVAAASAAKRIGMATVGFAGYDGGAMASSATFDVVAVVPSESVHRIQEAQAALVAQLVTVISE